MEFNLLDLLMKRRSIRVFKKEKLENELIQKLIKAGLLAPSSKNKKPVEFIVIDDRDTILKLKACKNKGIIGLETAPCAIVVIGDREKSDVWIEDASIAASYIQLEAEDLGLGTVWIQMRKRFSDFDNAETEVRKVLNIPENYGVLCIIAVGYKNEIRNSYNENDIDNSKVHYGKY
ncbi:MAG: nitroreductase family protein [Sedimentibacter sp.]|uniref:nitroreductase family protein n=1 Tax=Sedimentibacter sp. TaxID=1960295 RepID=UPI0029812715|nr:nitroreductase family protein [Sedimentibacter sp.]MDW5300520.1 nitroreductase family protein [Sedimentibacter sp.]